MNAVVERNLVTYHRNNAIRRTNELLDPKVLDLTQLNLPLGVEIISVAFFNDDTFVDNFTAGMRVIVHPIPKLSTETIRYTKNVAVKLDTNKKFRGVSNITIKEFRIQPPPNAVFITDFTSLINSHTFTSLHTNVYGFWKDITSTIIKWINDSEYDHPIFFPINIPDVFVTTEEINKLIKKSDDQILKVVRDYRMLLTISLFKFIYGIDSMFSQINPENYHRLTLVFIKNNKSVLLPFLNLMGIFRSKDYPGMSPMDSRRTIFAIYHLFVSISVTHTVGDGTRDSDNDIVDANDNDKKPKDDFTDNTGISEDEFEDKISRIENVVNEAISINDTGVIEEEVEIIKEEIFVNDGTIKDGGKLLEALNNIVGLEQSEIKKIKKALATRTNNYDKLDSTITKEDLKIVKRPFTDRDGFLKDSSKSDRGLEFDLGYVDKLYSKDILAAITSIESHGVIVTDVEIENHKDAVTDYDKISISTYIPGFGEHKIVQNLPRLHEDGTFKIFGNIYCMRGQILDLPIRKVAEDSVLLTTNFTKLFIKSTMSSDVSVKMAVMQSTELYLLSEKVNLPTDVEMSYLYMLSAKSFSYYNLNGFELFFSYNNRFSVIENLNKDKALEIEAQGYILCGTYEGDELFVKSDDTLHVYRDKKLTKVADLYELTGVSRVSDKTYSYIMLAGEKIPLFIFLINLLGFTKTLKLLNVDYTVTPPKRTYDELREDEMVIKFADMHVFITDIKLQSRLILNGITKKMKFLKNVKYGLEGAVAIANFDDIIGFPRKVYKETMSLKKLLIDKITLSVLEELNMPLTVEGICIEANRLLTVNKVKALTDMTDTRLRGRELIPSMLYKVLSQNVKAASNYDSFGSKPIKIAPYDTWDLLTSDSTVMLRDDANPYAVVRQKSDITYMGHQGRAKESMVIPTRFYHSTSLGLASLSVRDNGDSGITFFRSANPRIINNRGVFDTSGKDLHISEIYDSISMTLPNIHLDDGKRANFATTQGTGLFPMDGEITLPLRTYGEKIIGNKLDENMCINAITDCKVIEINEDLYIIVEYLDTKKKKKYFLGKYTSKIEDSICNTFDIVTIRKVGDVIKAGENITHNTSFFQPDFFNKKEVSMKTGKLARVRFAESHGSWEDSVEVDPDILSRMSVKKTVVSSIRTMSNKNIAGLREVGQRVLAGDPVMVITGEPIDIDMVRGDSKAYESLINLKSDVPKYSVTGTISRIVCYYKCEVSKLTGTLRKVINEADKVTMSREGVTGQIKSRFSINGSTMLDDEVYIAVYVDTDLSPMQVADKLIIGTQLKCTLGRTVDSESDNEDIDGKVSKCKTYDENGNEVEITYSSISLDKRIVNSVIVNGILLTYLSERSRALSSIK